RDGAALARLEVRDPEPDGAVAGSGRDEVEAGAVVVSAAAAAVLITSLTVVVAAALVAVAVAEVIRRGDEAGRRIEVGRGARGGVVCRIGIGDRRDAGLVVADEHLRRDRCARRID